MKYETTDYAGIDYGYGTANVDPKTGIRYGVIPVSEIADAWYSSAEEVTIPVCPYCGEDLTEYEDTLLEAENPTCPTCGEAWNGDDEYSYQILGYRYIGEGYRLYQHADDTDIFVEAAPCAGYFQFCSPCAPGAVHLQYPLSPDARNPNNLGYCLGPEWFDDEEAPYEYCLVDDIAEKKGE